MVQVRKVRRASVCGSAAGRFAPATIRYSLLSVLRSTFPAPRPQTEATSNPHTNWRQSLIAAFGIATMRLTVFRYASDNPQVCPSERLE